MIENGNKILMALLLGLFIVTSLQFVQHFFFHESKPGEDYPIIGDLGASGPVAPIVEDPAPVCHLLAEADSSVGETIVKANCTSCHQFNNEVHGQGPHLVGLIGRDVAGTDFGAYSSVLRTWGGQWDQESLNAFLHNPQQYIPGTAMNFAGWDNSKTRLRANVLVYLYNLSGAALPACPTAEQEMDEGDGAESPQREDSR